MTRSGINKITGRKFYFFLVALSFLISQNLWAQNKAYISIEKECLKHAFSENPVAQINGQNIIYNNKEQAIEINPNGMDTMYIDTSIGYHPTVLKLKKDEHYVIKCSTYGNHFDLIPVTGKKQGEIRFSKTNFDAKLAYKAFHKFLGDTLVESDMKTEYKRSSKLFYYHDIVYYKPPTRPTPRDPAPLAVINLIFLHGEKYTVVFNGETGEIEVYLDGYN
jgi:hypothetical protein